MVAVPSPPRPPRLRPAALALAAALAACQAPGGGPAAPLQLSATTLLFSAPPGSNPAPATAAVTVTGAGAAPVATVSAGGAGWLSAAVRGDGPYTVDVTVSSSALPKGLYLADVTLSSDGARAGVAVKLAVEDPPAPMTVRGHASYDVVRATPAGLDFESGLARPVRGAVVQALHRGAELARTTTDASGAYRVDFTPPSSLGLELRVLAQTASPLVEVRDNADGGALWAMFAEIGTGTTTQDLRATHGWTGAGYDPAHRIAAPFAILDATSGAETQVLAVRAATFPRLTVYWSPENQPSSVVSPSSGLIGTSHFDPGSKAIYVLGKAGVDTDEFDAHVVVHEWGHFLEDRLSRCDSPAGGHSAGDVADPRLAFSEGLGNAVAAMLLPETRYVDTFWSGGQPATFGFDAETEPAPADDGSTGTSPADDPAPSAFSEMAVQRLLYDLYDAGADPGGFDAVAIGLGGVYDLLTGRQRTTLALTTLAPVAAGARARAGVSGPALDALLAHYGVGPITDDFGAGDPGLAAMYTPVGSLGAAPVAAHVVLGGAAGTAYNMWAQNQYYRLTAAGSGVTVTAVAPRGVAVGLRAYRQGLLPGAQVNASGWYGGKQTLTFATTAGQAYVVSLFGFEPTSAEYGVDLTFQSTP
jgi:hypothetical protein